jgi:hypothetical protein
MGEDSAERPGLHFADAASLRAWLKGQPREVGLVLLARLGAALAANDNSWQAQTRWCDDCLAGRPRDEA